MSPLHSSSVFTLCGALYNLRAQDSRLSHDDDEGSDQTQSPANTCFWSSDAAGKLLAAVETYYTNNKRYPQHVNQLGLHPLELHAVQAEVNAFAQAKEKVRREKVGTSSYKTYKNKKKVKRVRQAQEVRHLTWTFQVAKRFV